MPKASNLGVKVVKLDLRPDTKFDVIAKALEQILTIPELPGGIRGGCRPCLSGLDRIVIENGLLERFGR
jgi:hypothetical protein